MNPPSRPITMFVNLFSFTRLKEIFFNFKRYKSDSKYLVEQMLPYDLNRSLCPNIHVRHGENEYGSSIRGFSFKKTDQHFVYLNCASSRPIIKDK